MTDPDILDWNALKWKRIKDRSRGKLPELRQMVQASAAVSLLTGDPAWDYLIQTLQNEQNDDQKALDAVIPTMARARPSQESLATIQLEVVRLTERMAVRERLMSLPKEIREKGDKALNLVREVERSQ